MQIATLQRLAKASSLSYLSIDKIPASPYYASSNLHPIAQVVDPQSQSGATLFRHINNTDDDDDDDSLSYIVACRGSANLKNFATNLKFGLVPATKLSFGDEEEVLLPKDALVHEGFQDASVGLWEELGPKLMNVLDENEIKTKEIVFTGHSLGGGKFGCILLYNRVCEETTHRGRGKLLPQTRAFFIVFTPKQHSQCTIMLLTLHQYIIAK